MHAAFLANADHGARGYYLTVGNDDWNVTGQNTGISYKVDIDSITVEEEGPGGVSGMSFTLWDPSLEAVVQEAARVEFWDITNNLPVFVGFIQSWDVSGVIGRFYRIQCIGIEVVLDWQVIPVDITFAAGANTPDAIQCLCAVATGIGVSLRSFRANSAVTNGTQATPIGAIDPAAIATVGILANAVTVTAGTTLREGIRQLTDQNIAHSDTLRTVVGSGNPQVTVDFTYGVRAWLSEPSDYADLTIVETVGSRAAADLKHSVDATGVPHQVWVEGGNAAGSGLVTDGTGEPGPVAVLTDSTITTSADRDAKAFAYLADKQASTRGSVTIEAYSPSTNIRAGSSVVLTNTAAGLTSASYVIAGIDKTFVASVQTWVVQYGGLRPSFARQQRRFTRSVLS